VLLGLYCFLIHQCIISGASVLNLLDKMDMQDSSTDSHCTTEGVMTGNKRKREQSQTAERQVKISSRENNTKKVVVVSETFKLMCSYVRKTSQFVAVIERNKPVCSSNLIWSYI
jgi:hypothetical protein